MAMMMYLFWMAILGLFGALTARIARKQTDLDDRHVVLVIGVLAGGALMVGALIIAAVCCNFTLYFLPEALSCLFFFSANYFRTNENRPQPKG